MGKPSGPAVIYTCPMPELLISILFQREKPVAMRPHFRPFEWTLSDFLYCACLGGYKGDTAKAGLSLDVRGVSMGGGI